MEDNNKKGWTIDRQIPIALIVTIIIQIVIGIWWTAVTSQKLETLIKEVATIKTDVYTQREAQKDKDYMNFKVDELTRRIKILEDRK